MKYILTEKEYNDLNQKISDISDMYFSTVQQLCTEVAVHKRIPLFGKKQAALPWGCIISEDPDYRADCCDECPVLTLCPYEDKQWSKE